MQTGAQQLMDYGVIGATIVNNVRAYLEWKTVTLGSELAASKTTLVYTN